MGRAPFMQHLQHDPLRASGLPAAEPQWCRECTRCSTQRPWNKVTPRLIRRSRRAMTARRVGWVKYRRSPRKVVVQPWCSSAISRISAWTAQFSNSVSWPRISYRFLNLSYRLYSLWNVYKCTYVYIYICTLPIYISKYVVYTYISLSLAH